MAIAGPAGAAFGVTVVFLVAGILPGFLAAATILLPRLDRDELAHPFDPRQRSSPQPMHPGDDRSGRNCTLDARTPKLHHQRPAFSLWLKPRT
jgi:hypothetical protein